MRDIKELEHAGDRITHDLIDLINRTFVTPFDRDDMFRLAGVLDDICDNIDDTAEKIVGYGVQEVRGQAREQASGRQPGGEEARRGDRPARRLQGLEAAADRAARARGRGRPPRARRHLGSLQRRRRCDHAHPLEGHPRAARGSGRRVRERGRRPRSDSRQEPLNTFLLVVVVAVALGFDFTNGFHDTANYVATWVGTRALSPRRAVLVSAAANLAGAFVTTAVAKTVGKGLIDTGLATEKTVLAALLGAIAWNLVTWYFGLPSSSTHALIGGLVGAALVQSGLERRAVARRLGEGAAAGPRVARDRLRRRLPAHGPDLPALLRRSRRESRTAGSGSASSRRERGSRSRTARTTRRRRWA